MIIIVSLEKPGTPTELVHAGVKGMKWGVRKRPAGTSIFGTTGKNQRRAREKYKAERKAQLTPKQKVARNRAKKVAIGVGVGVAVVGAAYVAHKMASQGKRPVLEVRKDTRGKSGQDMVAHLTQAEWDQKITNMRQTFRQLDTVSKSRAERGLKPLE